MEDVKKEVDPAKIEPPPGVPKPPPPAPRTPSKAKAVLVAASAVKSSPAVSRVPEASASAKSIPGASDGSCDGKPPPPPKPCPPDPDLPARLVPNAEHRVKSPPPQRDLKQDFIGNWTVHELLEGNPAVYSQYIKWKINQVDRENHTRYAATSCWNLTLYDSDFCADEDAIYPERVHRNRELGHIMSDALTYMSYTDLVEAAMCGRKVRVREVQNEFKRHVADLTYFSREKAINTHELYMHIPWDDDDQVIQNGFWIISHCINRIG